MTGRAAEVEAERSGRTPSLPADLLARIEERTRPPAQPIQTIPRRRRRGWLLRRMLLVADALGLSVSFLLTMVIFATPDSTDRVSIETEFLFFFLTLPGWLLLAKLYGLYDRDEERADHSTADDLVGVFHLITVGTWIFVAGALLTHLASPSLPKIVTFWVFAIFLVTTARAAARALIRRDPTYTQTTVIVGADSVGRLIARKFDNHGEYGIDVLGFVDADPPSGDDLDLPVLGPPEQLCEIVEEFGVERVVFAFSSQPDASTLELIRSLRDYDIQIDVVPRLFEVFGANAGIHTVEGLPLVGLPPFRLSRSALLLKRSLDLVLSGVALVLLAPFLVAIAVAIKLDSPGPALFRQTRMGSGGQTFRILKFRTMTVDAEARRTEVAHLSKHARPGGDPRMFKVPDDPRMTRVGRFLRHFSLDELPQLVNVLRGEMSLVGPRPLILDEDRHVAQWGRNRLRLKPGITGLWQVLGRDDIPFQEMVKLDYLYVAEWSLLNDIKLVLRTLPAVFRPRDAY